MWMEPCPAVDIECVEQAPDNDREDPEQQGARSPPWWVAMMPAIVVHAQWQHRHQQGSSWVDAMQPQVSVQLEFNLDGGG
jgi:hypothetical protein